MAIAELRLIKNVIEYPYKDQINRVPIKTRGIYALYQEAEDGKNYDLVYIGMARGLE